ncbi:CpsD/CapB family tyrosine-protein kinase [Paracoccus ravus]|uniref:CpsD/CapB family tyrosine-protein kinase n=1 Tax=Paracoccus ravus TaxID=2447760 RepID=UPI001FD70FFC|nr:CpsD/CapB family tyrosine-protein kinase [Paracoccus ravus]
MNSCRLAKGGAWAQDEGTRRLQAETDKNAETGATRAIATRPLGRQVSSSFIRREAARVVENQDHAKAIANNFSILRTRLLGEMRSRDWRRLAVIPVSRGAGASFVAIHLSLALARQRNSRVILIDLDLSRPSIARDLGIPGCENLGELMREGMSVADMIMVLEEAPNLAVLAPSGAEFDAAELLQDEEFAPRLDDLRRLWPDAIEIIDSGPLVGEDSGLALLPLVDAVLLVADGQKGTAADVAQVQRLLKDTPPVIGVILNKSED